MHSNKYTLLYAFGFTSIVAVMLAVVATSLAPRQQRNVEQAKRRAILQTVMTVDADRLRQDYDRYIVERVFTAAGGERDDVAAFDLDIRKEARKTGADRLLPLYVFRRGDTTRYIIPLQGKGLWGSIGAFVAMMEDRNTIAGVAFEHDKETPGLGAEISMDFFGDRFRGKRLFDEDSTLVSVQVLKGSGRDVGDKPHAVDGLTGATMTINGVNRMMREEIAVYAPILRRTDLADR